MDGRVKTLEERVTELEIELIILRNLVATPEPDWFQGSKAKLKTLDIMPFPFVRPNASGSYDYYRIIHLMHTNGIM